MSPNEFYSKLERGYRIDMDNAVLDFIKKQQVSIKDMGNVFYDSFPLHFSLYIVETPTIFKHYCFVPSSIKWEPIVYNCKKDHETICGLYQSRFLGDV